MKTDHMRQHGDRKSSLALRGVCLVYVLVVPCRAVTDAVKNLVINGNSLYLQKDFGGAQDKYNQAIGDDDTYAVAHTNLGLAYAQLGDFDEAVASAEKAIELGADEKRYRLNLGKLHAMAGRYDDANDLFAEAIALDENYKEAYYNRGWCHDERGKYELAVQDYMQAIAIDPSYTKAMIALAITRARQQTDDAVWWCKKAAMVSSDNLSQSWLNGLARQNLRTLRGTDFTFEDESSPGLFASALSHMIHDRTDQANEGFAHLVENEPNSALAHSMYARALVDTNDIDSATVQNERAFALLPQATLASWPSESPVFMDYYEVGSTDVNVPCFPGTYETTAKALPLIASERIEVDDPGPSVFFDLADGSQCLDVSALLTPTQSAASSETLTTYRVDLADLMHILSLRESGVLTDTELRDHGVEILDREGFFGGEGESISAELMAPEADIEITKAVATFAQNDGYLEFRLPSSASGPPPANEIHFAVVWTSLHDTGSFTLVLYPGQWAN